MNYTQQSLYDYIVKGIITPNKSKRRTLGEHFNPNIIVTYESKYSQRADITFGHLVKAYGFSVDTYRNYYTAYSELRDVGKLTWEHLAAPPFYFEETVPNLELPSTPQEVIDLRMQVANQQKQINILEEQLLQHEDMSNKLILILKNQDTMQKIITQQVMQSKSSVNETYTSSHNKEKEALQYIQKHFVTLVDSCKGTVSAFVKLKNKGNNQCDEMNILCKELMYLLEVMEIIEKNIKAYR